MSMSIRGFETRVQAMDLISVLTDLITDYGQMSIHDLLEGIKDSEQRLCYDKDDRIFEYIAKPGAEGNATTGWVTADGVKFMIINNPSGYWIVLPEPRVLPVEKTSKKSMAILTFKTEEEAKSLLVDLTDTIMEYNKLSIKDVLDVLTADGKEQKLYLGNDDGTGPLLLCDSEKNNETMGWVQSDCINFDVDKTRTGYLIHLPEAKLFDVKGDDEVSTRIALFDTKEEAQELDDKLVAHILEKGGITITSLLQFIAPYDLYHPRTIGDDKTKNVRGWVKEDITSFKIKKVTHGFAIYLPDAKLIKIEAWTRPTAIQEALDKGILQEMKPTLTETPPLLFNHNPEEKPLGYFIAYREGMDRKGALEATLKEMSKGVDGLMHPWELTSEARERLLEGLKEDDIKNIPIDPTESLEAIHEKLTENLRRAQGRMKVGQGEKVLTEHGAMRESNEGRGRFDLIPYESMEALAIWSEQGAIKYGDRNWEKGLSVKDCINRLIRHALKAGSGWTDEDHLAAAMWNASAAITMMKRRPDCDDHVWIYPRGLRAETGAIKDYPFTCPNCGGHYKMLDGIGKSCKECPWTEQYEREFTCPNCGGHNFKEDSAIGRYCTDCPWNEVLQQKEEMREYRQKKADDYKQYCESQKTTGADLQAADEYHERLAAQNAGLEVEFHSCPYCGTMEPKEKWYKYATSTPHECIIYTCKECHKPHEEVL